MSKLFTAFLSRFVTECTVCTAHHNWDRIANCVRSQKSNKIVKLNLINIECIFYFLYSRIVTFDSWLPNSAYSYFDFCLSTNKLKIQKEGPCFWWTPWEFFGQIVHKVEKQIVTFFGFRLDVTLRQERQVVLKRPFVSREISITLHFCYWSL